MTKYGDCYHADNQRVNLRVARGLVLECNTSLLVPSNFFLFCLPFQSSDHSKTTSVNTNISFSPSNTQFYKSGIFCLFTFWLFFSKVLNQQKKYSQKCQYNLLYRHSSFNTVLLYVGILSNVVFSWPKTTPNFHLTWILQFFPFFPPICDFFSIKIKPPKLSFF